MCETSVEIINLYKFDISYLIILDIILESGMHEGRGVWELIAVHSEALDYGGNCMYLRM